MYHPSMPWGSQESLSAGLTWATTCWPGGASGVRLKSNVPYSWAHAERFGLMRLPLSKLSVISAWGMRRSHRSRGNWGSVLHKPAMKWLLNVLMARSAAFRRCMCGGTNWKSTCCSCMYCFSCSEHSLSRRCNFGTSVWASGKMRYIITTL